MFDIAYPEEPQSKSFPFCARLQILVPKMNSMKNKRIFTARPNEAGNYIGPFVADAFHLLMSND
jgi:hypothetical protein